MGDWRGRWPWIFKLFSRKVIERLTELGGRQDDQIEPGRGLQDFTWNGQPGLISRITVIENNWGWMKWLAGIIGAIIGFIASTIVTSDLLIFCRGPFSHWQPGCLYAPGFFVPKKSEKIKKVKKICFFCKMRLTSRYQAVY